MEAEKDLHFAVLIDADNIPHRHIKAMLEEIAKYGTPTFKRIYGDWTKPQLSSWKGVLLENAITPIQQYSYTSGKNSTDSAMIIDAMDILYSKQVRGFCIVSSDSDFTRLATRLREAGMKVIGIGERKTPTPFIGACDKFIYLEVIAEQDQEQEQDSEKGQTKSTQPKNQEAKARITKDIIKLICQSVEDVSDDDGWANAGEVGALLIKKRTDFDPRNFGFSRLTPMLKSMDKYLEVDERSMGQSSAKNVYVRTHSYARKYGNQS